jgi:hypothetical protein
MFLNKIFIYKINNMRIVILFLVCLAIGIGATNAQTPGTGNTLGTTGVTAIQSGTNANFKLTVGGAVKLYGVGGVGTATAPSLLLTNTTATTGRGYGIHVGTNGVFQIYDTTAPTAPRLIINNLGNIGLGTISNPTTFASLLNLGSTAANAKLAVWDNGTIRSGLGWQTGQLRLHLSAVTDKFSFLSTEAAAADLMTILGSGNVGIGISPLAQFHTTGTVRFDKFKNNAAGDSVLTTDASGNLKLKVVGAAAAGWNLTGNTGSTIANYLGTNDNISLRFRTNNVQRMILDSTGNVGIGIVGPLAQFHTTGTVRFDKFKNNAALDSLLTTDINGNLIFKKITIPAAVDSSKWTLSGTNIFSKNTGNVGIGTNAPTAKLSINSGTAGVSGLQFTQLNSGTAATLTGGKVLALDASGNVVLQALGGLGQKTAINNADWAGAALTPNNGGTGLSALGTATQQLRVNAAGTALEYFTPAAGIAGWNLTGNTGISPSNFLGTADNNSLRFRTNNLQRILLDSNGNVGIGTNSPASLLHVNGTYTQTHPAFAGTFSIRHNVNNQVVFNNSAIGDFLTAGPANIVDFMGQQVNALQRGALLGNTLGGNALITTAPVQFQNLINDNTVTRVLGTDINGNLKWRDASTLVSSFTGWGLTGNAGTSVSNFLGTADNNSLRFRTNNLQRMVLDSNGNVGIGINNPAYPLTVVSSTSPFAGYFKSSVGNTRIVIDNTSNSNAGFLLSTNGAFRFSNAVYQANAGGNIDYTIYNEQTAKPSIFVDGNSDYLGLGTINPLAQLHTTGTVRLDAFKNNATGDSVLTTDASGNLRLKALAIPAATDSSKWTSSGNNIFSKNTGNVGIGVTNPTEKLTIAGNNKILFTPVSVQNQSSSIGTDIDDNLKLVAGMNLGKFITLGDLSSNWMARFGAGGASLRGNVGIGVESPVAQLHTNGTVRFENYKNNSAGDSVLTTDANGNLVLRSATSLSTPLTFSDGLTSIGDSVKIGGALTENTSINVPANKSLQITTDNTNTTFGDANSKIHLGANYTSHFGTNNTQNWSLVNVYEKYGVNGENPSFLSLSTPNINAANGFQFLNFGDGNTVYPMMVTKSNYRRFGVNIGYMHRVNVRDDSDLVGSSGFVIDVFKNNDPNAFQGFGLVTNTKLFSVFNQNYEKLVLNHDGKLKLPFYANNAARDSVLTTDSIGNLVLRALPAAGSSYSFAKGLTKTGNNVTIGGKADDISLSAKSYSLLSEDSINQNGQSSFYSGPGFVQLSSSPNNWSAVPQGESVLSVQRYFIDLHSSSGPADQYAATLDNQNFSVGQKLDLGDGYVMPVANLQVGKAGNIKFGKYLNNESEDSVLTTDASGNLKLKAFTGKAGSGNWSSNGNNIYNSNIGNVGINTINPKSSLHVRGANATNWGIFSVQDSVNSGSNGQALVTFFGADSNRLSYFGQSYSHFVVSNEVGNGAVDIAPINGSVILGGGFVDNGKKLQVNGSGYVRDSLMIGTTNPLAQLHTTGTIRFDKYKNNASEDSVLTTDASGNLKLKALTGLSGGNDISKWLLKNKTIYSKDSLNVGIGVDSALAKFHVKGSVRLDNFKNNPQGDSVLTTDIDGNLKFTYLPYGSGGGGGGAIYNFTNGVQQVNGTVSLGGLLQDSAKINLNEKAFHFNNGADRVLSMSAAGNVGIGTTGPASGYKLLVNGDASIGNQMDSVASGNKLSFNGNGNQDGLFIQRTNTATNSSELRVNIGDDGVAGDKFNVGYYPSSGGAWKSNFIVQANGQVGVGTSQVNSELSVGTQHGTKLSVGNAQWGQTSIITTGTDALYGDYTEIKVPGSSFNNSFIRMSSNGNVGIGTVVLDTPYVLAVNGKIRSKGLRVESGNWADFVFEPGYKMRTLNEVEKFIEANKHLPEMPTTADVQKNGQDVGEVQVKLLQKIEELTLYAIEQNKKITALEEKNKKQEEQGKEINDLKKQLEELKNLVLKNK